MRIGRGSLAGWSDAGLSHMSDVPHLHHCKRRSREVCWSFEETWGNIWEVLLRP